MDNILENNIYTKQINNMDDEWKLILDNVQDAIFIKDGNGNIQWINKSCELLYDIKKENIIGVDLEEMEEKKIFSHSVAKLVINSKKQETRFHSNRTGKKLLVTCTPIIDNNGDIYKIIVISRDITELVYLRNKVDDIQHKLRIVNEEEDCIEGTYIFRSEEMKEIVSLAKRLSHINSSILITGSSGVGKGVIAKLIHDSGDRKNRPFVKVNCGAIPEALLESELFGYEYGAFTGSRKEGKIGLFQAADGGTIFLDEIGDLPKKLQVKLLDFIQEKTIQKVGGIERIAVDTRIITATNKDLLEMVQSGKFREDLYYRINVIPLNIRSLRERSDDIIPLIRHFLNNFNEKFKTNKHIDPNTLRYLLEYSWPGNVRELENIIERLVAVSEGDTILPQNLPNYIINNPDDSDNIVIPSRLSLKDTVEKLEKHLIMDALARCKNTRETARNLGVSQSTIVRKINKYRINTG